MRQFLRYGIGIAVMLVIVLVPLVSAQSKEVNLHIDDTNTNDFPTVRVFASATDAQGRALPDLNEQNFVLTEDGKGADIEDVRLMPPEDVKLQVVLVLDISGSIAWDSPENKKFSQERLDLFKQSAENFVESLNEEDQVALVLFGDESYPQCFDDPLPRSSQDCETFFTTDHGLVRNRIQQEIVSDKLSNYTALYNGAFDGVRIAGERDIGRRTVVLMTDGSNQPHPEVTQLEISDVLSEAKDKRARVYVMGVGTDVSETDLRTLATDGRYYSVDDPEQLDKTYTDIATELRQQYEISYDSNLEEDGKSHAIGLSVNTKQGGASATTSIQTPPPPATPTPPPVVMTMPITVTLGAPFLITADIRSDKAIELIEMLVDGEIVFSEEPDNQDTWTYEWIPDSELEEGTHVIEVIVTDEDGKTTSVYNEERMFIVGSSGGIPAWLWIVLVLVVFLVLVLIAVAIIASQRRQPAIVNIPSSHPAPLPTGTFSPKPSGVSTEPPTTAVPPPKSASPSGGAKPTEVDGDTEIPLALLAVEQGKASPNELRLVPTREYKIGRATVNDLVIPDSRTSSEHATIRFMENGFTIVDLGSTNGTWVNRNRVDRLRLQHDDRVEIGGTTMVFKSLR
jgi:hypothetical protein